MIFSAKDAVMAIMLAALYKHHLAEWHKRTSEVLKRHALNTLLIYSRKLQKVFRYDHAIRSK
jgi:Xaa-Pro dipeptidase